ncbi:MAG TPA: peptidoglycan bridge formation glycyltransferase FemA/FemB family protein [Patescibacteria group bacterium]
MKDLRQTSEWASYLKSIGWKVEKINGNYYFLKRIPLLGYLLKVQRPKKLILKDIKYLQNKYKIYQTTIEPDLPFFSSSHNLLLKNNFKKGKSFSLPTKTIQIDLTKSEKNLLLDMSSKTRYNINLSKKKGVEITHSKNINEFAKFWRENFERKRFPFLSQKKSIIAIYDAFGNKSDSLIAKKNKKIIAGLLLLSTNNTIYYMYAASNSLGRKLFAPTLLTWQAILLGKKCKHKVFDFDGIYDERFPLNSWKGFTKFKKGFGGNEVEYPGSFKKTNSIIKL